MYHLRLTKGLSYCGLVNATRKQPDVFVADKATADAAVASGYFRLISEESAGVNQTLTSHLDRGQLEEMKADDLKRLAEDMGIEIKGPKKAQIIDAIASEEITVDASDDNLPDYGEED